MSTTLPSKLQSRYQISSAVGKGGAGEVFIAWDTQLERTVAIKRLKATGIHDDAIQGTWQEAMRLAAIRHPNIVAVYDIGADDGTPYIVMEYVQGETIDRRIARGVLGLDEFVEFAQQSLEGLLAAHHAGMIHRDLKPSNLMIEMLPTGTFQVKILDFGIARFLSAPAQQTTNFDGTITGSIHCISPEQLNQDSVDLRSDLYSIGCVFYYALAGHYPFIGKRISEIITAHLNHQVVDLKQYRPELPALLCDWVMALINKKPLHRYQSAKEALTAFHSILQEGQTTPATGKPNAQTPVTTASGNKGRGKLIAPASISLALVASAAFLFRPPQQAKDFAVKPVSQPPQNVVPGSSTLSSPVVAEPVPQVESIPKAAAAIAATPTAQPSAAAVPSLPEPAPVPVAPAKRAEVVLRFAGSNTIGAKLLPALVERFLQREGATEIQRKPGKDPEEMELEARLPGSNEPQAIEVSAHGSKTAFDGLVAGTCEIGMASRPVKKDEAEVCVRAGLGDMQSSACEHILGLDGIAILAHKSNPIGELSKPQIADIFSGKITDWSQVGGKPGPIALYSRDGNSGTYDTFKSLVLGSGDVVPTSRRFEDSNELSDAVAADPQGIGFVGLPFVRSAKLLAVSEPGAAPFLATRFTVATEDYLLSRRLFLYTPANPQNPLVSRFIDFALSEDGQEIVSKAGFVKQSIDLQRPVQPIAAPAEYTEVTKNAERLNLNFRFRAGQVELDNKALRDLDRIAALLSEPRLRGRRLILLGFADGQGASAANTKISKDRARAVGQHLVSRGITPAVITGVGSVLPVASNDTEQGRDKNRRVEVWLKEKGL